MCGLVGIAGDLEVKDEGTMKRLFVYDFFRGPDSTGFAAFTKLGNVRLCKVASHPIDLFDMKKFNEALSGYGSKVFLGHNRSATRGKVNGMNAHPFEYGNIVGAHNGTLDKVSWERLEEAIGEKTDVDSAALIMAIDKIGIKDTISLIEEGKTYQEGAWALVWFNTQDNTLNFLRNQHRPLWFSYSSDFRKLFWASEWPMIESATKMSPASYELFKSEEGYKFWEAETDKLYSFDLEKLRSGTDMTNVHGAIVGELKGREPTRVSAGSAPFKQNRVTYLQDFSKNSTTTTGSVVGVNSDLDLPDMLQMYGTKSSPLTTYMSRERFNDLARFGCSWCQEDVEYDEPGVTILEAEQAILCPTCSNLNGNSRIYVEADNLENFRKQLKAVS